MSPAALPALGDPEFHAFRHLIRGAAGIHLTEAKKQLVASRLAPRLRHHGLTGYGEYLEHVTRRDHDGAELREMINCITTNKTDFFREAHHFDFLETHLFPKAAEANRPLYVWSAGCSTGEEPYTLAMLARKAFGENARRRLRIIASDIDTAVLARARDGVYDESRLSDIPEGLRRASFLRGTGIHGGTARIRPEVAELVEFRQVNLAASRWPVEERFDAILCRNVIIYFDQDTRQQLIQRFAERLRPGGYLALGHSESLPPHPAGFQPLGATLFRLGPGAVDGPHGHLTDAAEPLQLRRLVAGDVVAGLPPLELVTLLGSCVAVCIYDPEAAVGGMNHFLLPGGGHGERGPAGRGRYGIDAMALLLDEVVRLGGVRRRLVAKAFGGASVLDLQGGDAVARRNVRFVRECLDRAGIPLVGERLGGSAALEIRMDLGTGRVRVRPMPTPEAHRYGVVQTGATAAELLDLASADRSPASIPEPSA